MSEQPLFPVESAPAIEDVLHAEEPQLPRIPPAELHIHVQRLLSISQEPAEFLVQEAERIYINRMRQRFSELKVSDRLKRTNPFLLRIRGAKTVRDWAELQVQSALFASEEEATGHLLETIAKTCFPGAAEPTYIDDLDFEVQVSPSEIHAYQVKMSWDAMPMSSRKNLSNTMRGLEARLSAEGRTFIGFYAPCYGKAKTTRPKGQDYISLASKEFWERVGKGRRDFDVSVGEVCALLCAESRTILLQDVIPTLLDELTAAALPEIGDPDGSINYIKLFRRINR